MIPLEELGRMREMMDSVFKFKIYDFVQPKALGDYADIPSGHCTHSDDRRDPQLWGEITFAGRSLHRYQVVERWLQECHGGIQKHYHIRLIDSNGLIEAAVRSVTEDELVSSTPYKRLRGLSKKAFQSFVDSLPDDAEAE